MTIRRVQRPEDPDTPQESTPSLEDSISSFSNTFRQVVDRKENNPSKQMTELDAAENSSSNDRYHDEEYHDEEPTPQQDTSGYGEPPPAYVESVEDDQVIETPIFVPPFPSKEEHLSDRAPQTLPRQEKARFRHVLFFVLCATVLALFVMFQSSSSITSGRDQYGSTRPLPSQPIVAPAPKPDPSRSVIRRESHQSIKGTFTLYDLIDVSTSSGSISLTIQLEDETAYSTTSNPGLIRISSTSGSISLNFIPPSSTSRRTHHLSIQNTAGRVSGNILHGGSTNVSTTSGSINLTVSPTSALPVTTFSSFSDHGSQKIIVNDFALEGPSLTNFKASIIASGSSSIKVQMPPSWEGKMHTSSGGSGSVKVTGSGLHLEQRGEKDFAGYRGSGKDLLPIEVQGMGSGSIRFSC